MNSAYEIEFLWIPPDLGGHRGEPYQGMRTQVRFPRNLDAFVGSAPDVTWQEIEFDPKTMRGRAVIELSKASDIQVEEREIVEIVNGPRILAIGKVTKHVRAGN